MSNTMGKERMVCIVDALIDMHDETHRKEGKAMEEATHQQPAIQTDRGALHSQPTMRLKVPDGAACELGETVACNGFDATESELLQMLQSLIPLTGENLDQWTWEERRDFLNWCVDEGVLTIQDGRLVPV